MGEATLYTRLIERIAQAADEEARIEDIRIYTNWVLVKTAHWSLSTVFHGMPGLTDHLGMDTWMGDWLGRPGLESALELLASRDTLKRSVGMACLKSLLPEPADALSGNAIDLVAEACQHAPTCFIGHFKIAAEWRALGRPVTIVELYPRPGDIHWNEADEPLAQAELVLMTGLTLVNDTLQAVIERTPKARLRVIMGPTVPASTALLDNGLDLLGVTLIEDMDRMDRYARLGGGSIAHAPAGSLQSLNLVKDAKTFTARLAELTCARAGKG